MHKCNVKQAYKTEVALLFERQVASGFLFSFSVELRRDVQNPLLLDKRKINCNILHFYLAGTNQ